MKRTLTVNLNNIVFHIDDDAFEMLQDYLNDISDYIESDDERKEIMQDIEARIAELFNERLQKGKNVVTDEDVKQVISIMGKPNEFVGQEEKPKSEKKSKSHSKKHAYRRYYRDPENCIIGGVAGGLAAYFGWNVSLVRILMVIAGFIGMGTIIPIYFVMWLVSPEAKTMSQRLEMQGEDVTIDSIKSEFDHVKSYVKSDEFKQKTNTIGSRLIQIIQLLIKPLVAFIGAIFGLVTVITVIIIVSLVGFLIFNPSAVSIFNSSCLTPWTNTPENYALLLISILLIIGCPVFMIFFWAIRFAKGNLQSSRSTSWVAFILWLAGIFMLLSVVNQPLFCTMNNENLQNAVTHENEYAFEQNRVVSPFKSIDLEGHIELCIVQDSVQQVIVYTQNQYQQSIKTEVRDGILQIKTNGISLNRISRITLHVDTLEGISAKGACAIHTMNQLTSSNLKLKIKGACEADLSANIANTLDVETDGASDLNISGKCNTFRLKSAGASDIDAEKMIAQKCMVELKGASDAKVYASQRFEGDAMGLSHIKCYGHPSDVSKDEHFTSSIILK